MWGFIYLDLTPLTVADTVSQSVQDDNFTLFDWGMAVIGAPRFSRIRASKYVCMCE